MDRLRLAAGWISMLAFATGGMMTVARILHGAWSLAILLAALAIYAFVTFFPEPRSSTGVIAQPEKTVGGGLQKESFGTRTLNLGRYTLPAG